MFPIHDLLAAFNAEQDAERRKTIEMEIQNIQTHPLIVDYCISWLNEEIKFFAAQTILLRLQKDSSILTEGQIQSILSLCLCQGHHLRPASLKKLIQVVSLIMINNHSKSDKLFQQVLHAPNNYCVLLLLAEIPIDLERLSTLTSQQYTFKCYISEQSDHVQARICRAFNNAAASPDDPLAAMECFSSWSSIKSFRDSVINEAFHLVMSYAIISESHLHKEKAFETIIHWLESGIEGVLLKRLFPALRDMQPAIFSMFQTKRDLESVRSILKIFRQFFELAMDYIVEEVHFLTFLMQLALMEPALGQSPKPEIIYFWVEYVQYHRDKGLKLVMAEDLITLVVQIVAHLKGTLGEYMTVLQDLFQALFNLEPMIVFQRMNRLLSSEAEMDKKTGKRLYAWIAPLLTDDQVSQTDWKDMTRTVLSTCSDNELTRMAPKASKLIVADPELHLFVGNSLLSTRNFDSFASIMDPLLDTIVLQNANVLNLLSGKEQVFFFSIVCESVERRAPEMVSELVTFIASCADSNHQLLLLTTATKKLQDITPLLSILANHQFPPWFEGPSHLESTCKLWSTVVERCSSTNSSMILSLISPSLPNMLSLLNSEIASVLELLINVCQPIVHELTEQLIRKIIDEASNEEVHLVCLPLLNKSLKLLEYPILPGTERLADIYLERLAFRSLGDDYLCAIVKFFTILFVHLPLDFELEIFGRLIQALRLTLTDAQLDIVAPLTLLLLMTEPIKMTRILEPLADNTTKQEIVKKIAACRMPRLLARLLFQLIH